MSEYADQLWTSVIAADEQAAVDLLLHAMDGGLDEETVLLDVIGAVQRRIGNEWAANRIGVAQEHAATAINERVIGVLRHHRDRRGRGGARPPAVHKRVVVTCVDGEWHALPARLVAEVLEIRGFVVDYLGGHVPAPHLVEHLHRSGADAVALSGSIATRLPAAHATITACVATGVPVLAGGRAFGVDGRYALLLGAHAWAPDARSAADLLTAGLTPIPSEPTDLNALPHLEDQEYTQVVRSRPALVKILCAKLESDATDRRGWTEIDRRRTAEDLRELIGFLATTLYLDDDDLFTSFLLWAADVARARDAPTTTLFSALRHLLAQLRDFPRTIRIINVARAQLSEHLRTPMTGRFV